MDLARKQITHRACGTHRFLPQYNHFSVLGKVQLLLGVLEGVCELRQNALHAVLMHMQLWICFGFGLKLVWILFSYVHEIRWKVAKRMQFAVTNGAKPVAASPPCPRLVVPVGQPSALRTSLTPSLAAAVCMPERSRERALRIS
jgi:hypothetical protein